MRRVQFDVALLDDDMFRRLSSDARLTVLAGLPLAAKLGAGGALNIQGWGPMTVAEIANYTGLTQRQQAAALTELARTPFLEAVDDAHIIKVPFEAIDVEVVALSARPEAARKRRYRSKRSAGHNAGQLSLHEAGQHTGQVSHDNAGQLSDHEGGLQGGAPPETPARHSPTTSSSDGDTAEKPGSVEHKKPVPDTSWVQPMRSAVLAIADAIVPNLTLEQRLILGQYAAWKWANCTQDLASNRRKARQFASQIESIGAKVRFASMSVREFIGAGDRFWQTTDRHPVHNLWTILAAIEREPQPVGRTA